MVEIKINLSDIRAKVLAHNHADVQEFLQNICDTISAREELGLKQRQVQNLEEVPAVETRGDRYAFRQVGEPNRPIDEPVAVFAKPGCHGVVRVVVHLHDGVPRNVSIVNVHETSVDREVYCPTSVSETNIVAARRKPIGN